MRPVFLGEAAIPIPTQAGGEGEIGAELKLILDVGAGLAGAIVAVGVALQKFGGGEVVVDIDESLNELGKVGARNDALVGSFVGGR